ncbi:MAG TPA: hypothetical protein DIT07_01315 [Sphingobacteriaceae bacterium]|nr:hypothetical protein [Sphingobacteriaceae bacterium]
MLQTFKKLVKSVVLRQAPAIEKEAEDAYDLWSENYDDQPDNLMLALDEELFTKLLRNIGIKDKQIADIGCGTGRHWQSLLSQFPSKLTGYDVSDGMLNKLKAKFPQADVKKISDNTLASIEDQFYDIIISTLTIAHIINLDEAIQSWSRILKQKGEIIITDFHPDALALGAQRTFSHKNQKISIANYVHSVDKLIQKFAQEGFVLISKEEKIIDESVKHIYEKHNALPVYEKFKGVPIIYGLHIRRDYDPQ